MKKIKLNQSQFQLILDAIEERLRVIHETELKQLVDINKANVFLKNISEIEQPIEIDKAINSAIISCVNSYIGLYYTKVQIPEISEWLCISNDLQQKLINFDNLRNILFQCGYYENKTSNLDFKYSDFLKAIEIIKDPNNVFLDGYNNIYDKIAFVKNQQYILINLQSLTTWKSLLPCKINGYSEYEFGETKFTEVVSKLEALHSLESSNIGTLNSTTFSFVLNSLKPKF